MIPTIALDILEKVLLTGFVSIYFPLQPVLTPTKPYK